MEVLDLVMEKIHQILRGKKMVFKKLPTILSHFKKEKGHLVQKIVAASLNLFLPLPQLVRT